MSSHGVISSDSHILEPEDLWEKRIDREFRDRGPHLVHEVDVDQWYCDGLAFGDLGTTQQFGLRFEEPENLSTRGRMDTQPLGGLDPDAHVRDMDLDGIDGGVLYPSQGLSMFRVPASDVVSAAFRAYNDYLAEFCKPYPHRLKGIAMVNVDDVEDGVGELGRIARMGLAGAMITVRPLLRYDHPAYERLWASAQDLDVPLSLHAGTMRWMPGMDVNKVVVQDPFLFPNSEYHVRESINSMIFSGVFDRHPNLKAGAIEFGIAWAPYFLDRMDEFYKERAAGVRRERFRGDALPSDIFRRNIFSNFQEDDFGVQVRHRVGVDNLMWGSDYPHAESTFPRSREIVERIMQGVPQEEKAKILRENAAKLYHFD